MALAFLTALPVGLSVVGCGHKTATPVYCNASDTGPQTGQVATISLSPTLATTGLSLNYQEIGSGLSATAADCKGTSVSVSKYVYASSNMNIVDINPSTGATCAGIWNRNTGGGILDYTICNPYTTTPAPAATSVVSLPATSTPVAVAPSAIQCPSGTASGLTCTQYTASAAGVLNITGGTNLAVSTTTGSATLTSGYLSVSQGEVVTLSYSASATAPTVLYTPATYTATAPGAVQLLNGAVSTVVDSSGGVTTVEPSTTGIYQVGTGDYLTIIYSAAPTAIFIPSGALAYVTATASGATSNAIAVYVHPVATGIVLGGPTSNCTTDPGTDCCPNNTLGTTVVASPYQGTACISQNTTGQLIARIYANGKTDAADNITCQVGHISFAPQTANIVSIDENGVVTANQPGSTLITATVSNSSSGVAAGFASTCPPKNITLTIPSTGTSSANVNVNNLLPITAVVTDTNNVVLNGLSLTYESTSPQTIPVTTGSTTPIYPGTATITVTCEPGTCNPAPLSQIGYLGNGQPLTSNGVTINAVGTAGTIIYMGSTGSQYVLPHDFVTGQTSSLIKLPYQLNSMVITQDGTEIYMGSSSGLMSIATATNALGAVNTAVPGTVLSVSPDGTQVVVTDPTRSTVSLYSPSTGAVTTSYGGIGNSAKWTPDSSTVYITLQSTSTNGNALLTHSSFTNWVATPLNGTDAAYRDVAVMVPAVGAYFAGDTTVGSNSTEGRSYCPAGTLNNGTQPPSVTNNFAPLADEKTTNPTDKLAATNDGLHILGATATGDVLSDISLYPVLHNTPNPEETPCPPAGTPLSTSYFPTTVTTTALAGISATTINGVVPAANSSVAFVTYAGSSGILPEYIPSATGNAGTYVPVTLGNGATTASAPTSGVFSTDGLSFYAGTSGDNQVHIFTLNGTTATETGVITPALPPFGAASGSSAVNLLVQKPRKTTN